LRCVFDTNVYVSAAILADSKPRRALDFALQHGKVLLSFATITEVYEVLNRKQFRRYVNDEDIRLFLRALTRETESVDVNVRIAACRDSSDDKFLELAVSGNATHIVTGDLDLLELDAFQGIRIIRPQTFLELMATLGSVS
jgi:putative PIN family toxin of toxin-antitoxin system